MAKQFYFISLLVVLVIGFAFWRFKNSGVTFWARKEAAVSLEQRDYPVGVFDEIVIKVPSRIVVQQASHENVSVVAPANILGRLQVLVHDKKLLIESTDILGNNMQDISITIAGSHIDELTTYGATDITIPSFKAEKLELELDGATKLVAHVDVAKLSVETSGTADVSLAGSARHHEIEIKGSGSYKSVDLDSELCEIAVHGAASFEVGVSKRLVLNIDGSATVGYKGNPAIEQKSAHGVVNSYKI